jgi:uncharacterized protein (DUF58 family)
MKRIYAILLLLTVSLLLALGSGVPVYFRVFFLTALVMAVSFIWAYVNRIAIKVTSDRTYGKLRVGEYLESHVTIHSSSPLPKFSLEVNDLSEVPGHNTGEVFNLPPFGELSLVLKIPLMKRGIYSVGAPMISSRDPFGIFRLRHRKPGVEQLAVLPYMVDIPPFSLAQGDISGEGSLQRSTPEATASASTIREYRSGDSTRYIHWPATARRDKLMMKQYDGGMEDVTWILLDLQGEVKEGGEIDNTEEYAITAAASIAKSYSELGWAVGLMAQGDRQYILAPQEGPPSLDRIFAALTEAHAEGIVPLRDLLIHWQSQIPSPTVSLVVITSSVDPEWDVALESSIRQGVSATVVLIDPTSFRSTGGAPDDPGLLLSQLQRRGVTTHLLRKDEDLFQALQHPWHPPGTSPAEEREGARS